MTLLRRPLSLLAALLVAAAPAVAGAGWELVSKNDGVSVFRRDHAGSAVKEIRAFGSIDATAERLEDIVDDVKIFKKIIPYMATATVLNRGESFVVSHHRIELPMVEPRDVVVKLNKKESTTADGRKVLDIRFRSLDGAGPPPKAGVVRMETLTGRAKLTQNAAGGTDVEIRMHVEPGGKLPSQLVNMATQKAAPMVIDNLESVAKGGDSAGVKSAKK